ncbi:hypothetical protein HR08_02080 [Porphyromonas gulae]|uniref:Uncharacterized protein n=1 Tax=Porphyromonas gulae TaxID=111105 RepID=A0A0A2F916_9PORP|nr:hypothetical protein HR08_02080 [Porphyromonas gulae]
MQFVRRVNLQIRHEIHRSNLEEDKSAPKCLPPSWSNLFRLHSAVCPACKPANRARNSLPQIAGKHFRTKKPRRKLRNDKFALKKAAATCEKLFRVKDVVPQLAATFFGHAMQIPRRTFPLLPKAPLILFSHCEMWKTMLPSP